MKLNQDLNKWSKTNRLYNDWVSKKDLRNFFSKEINYEGFSLWWITRIISKDNVVENKWYKDLHNHLNGKQLSYNYNWFLFILKFIKNFSLSFFDLIFYKIYNLFFNSYFKKKNLIKLIVFTLLVIISNP